MSPVSIGGGGGGAGATDHGALTGLADDDHTQYTTTAEATALADAAAAAVVDSAPGTLDTLNELAAALGDDANFATTTANSLAGKIPLSIIDAAGDLIVGTADNTVGRLGLGTALYVLRVNAAGNALEYAAAAAGGSDATFNRYAFR